ncbi:MAG TPA: hypothetical protein PLK37_05245 [Terricaulis sp.]|nr:hypothetical protein [Terricaulis sp.]
MLLRAPLVSKRPAGGRGDIGDLLVRILIGIVVLLAAFFVFAPSMLDPRGAYVPGVMQGRTLVLKGDAFRFPDPSPEQTVTVTPERALRIEVRPDQPLPTPAERGVRVLLSPEDAAFIDDKMVLVEIEHQPSQAYWRPAPAASAIAVSLQGIGPARWIIHRVTQETGKLTFEAHTEFEVNAIGLRAISETPNQGGSVEITQIRITPISH